MTTRAFVLAAIIPGAWLAVASSSHGDARPNVLFIVVDDWNDWVGCLGDRQAQTPNVDRLARRGVLFTNAHCAAPVCNPSRASVLTGLRPDTTGVYENNHVMRRKVPEVVTLPQHFRTGGYASYGGGKIFHDVPPHCHDSPSWDEYFWWNEHAHKGGQWRGQWRSPYSIPPDPQPQARPHARIARLTKRNFDWAAVDRPAADWPDYQVTEWARDFLARDHANPFFLAVGIFRPHVPWFNPREYFERYPLDQVKLPPVRENDLDDLGSWARNRALDSASKHDKVMELGEWKGAVQAYLASISFADAMVGRVLEALDRSHHRDNTIVVFWSDHGYHLGEKRHWHKRTLWERSTHVPLIVAAPGVTTPSTKCDKPVNLLDIYPTLVELCGLDRRDDLEGTSLVPLLADTSAQWQHASVTTYRPGNHSVRTERWRYIQYANGEQELYDHAADPNEWHNLADDPKHAAAIKGLETHLPKRQSADDRKTGNDMPVPGNTKNVRATRNDHPNVLFILVDDLGWSDLGCYGSRTYETPHVDRLATEGMRFTDFYAAGPVCSPTRASILTGKYPVRTGITTYLISPQRDASHVSSHLSLDEFTIGEALQKNGYRTGYFGKWHLGYQNDHWAAKQGFEVAKGGMDLPWAWKLCYPDRDPPTAGTWPQKHTRFFSPYHLTHLENGPDGEYLTDRLTDETIRFIEQSKDRPFFAFLSFHTVHTPLQAKPVVIDKYRRKIQRLALHKKHEKNQREKQYQNHPNYAAMVQHMDENVGRILRRLDQLKLAKDTVVVFTSDNGGKGSVTSNVPLRGMKHNLYEGGIRVPLIIRWPANVRAGSRSNCPLISNDFYPTLLDLAGLQKEPQQHLDGVSFNDVLTGQDDCVRRDALYWHYPHGRHEAAIRMGVYKLIHFHQNDSAVLYNLKEDLGERHDLSGDNPDVAQKMLTRLKNWQANTGAQFGSSKK